MKDGWEITGNPFVMTYGERFLFVDLGAAESPLPHYQEGGYIDAQRAGRQIAVEIKDSPGGSTMDTTEKYR
ncbi:MAG: fatty-acid synthase, partial [bacterium]|nr:fatty-acid synthase [bacterium]